MCSFKQYRLISLTECFNKETHRRESIIRYYCPHRFNARKITAKIAIAAASDCSIFSKKISARTTKVWKSI